MSAPDDTPDGLAEFDAVPTERAFGVPKDHDPTTDPLTEGQAAHPILATAPDGVITIDERGTVEAFSPAAQRIFGYAPAEVIGQNVKMLMPEPYHSQHDGYMKNYIKTGHRKIIGLGRVVVGRRSDGSSFPMELAVGEATIEGRRIFTGFVRDITARQLEKQRLQDLQHDLLHASRLSALGEMASGLAHELNQPLTAISNYSLAGRRLSERDSVPEKVVEILGKIGEQAQRAGEIIKRLRAFVRKGEMASKPENANMVVEEAAGLALVGTADRSVTVDWRLAEDLPLVYMDRVQIQQVVLNLVRNALDAMTDCSNRRLILETKSKSPETIHVRVSDSGPGVSPDILEKLFTPFQTTKADGMGIGLAMCQTIIQAHGGELIFEENLELGGATFQFCLPVEGADY